MAGPSRSGSSTRRRRWSGCGVEVVERQRGEGGRGVEPAADQVPQDRHQLVVGEGTRRCPCGAVRAGPVLDVDLHGDEGGEQVIAWLRPAVGDLGGQLGEHGGHVGDGRPVLGAARRVGDGPVEQLGVVVPVVDRQADEVHREHGRDRVGVVEHQVDAARCDVAVEEPVGCRFHPRGEPVDGGGDEERVEHPPQGGVQAALDLGDAGGRDGRRHGGCRRCRGSRCRRPASRS